MSLTANSLPTIVPDVRVLDKPAPAQIIPFTPPTDDALTWDEQEVIFDPGNVIILDTHYGEHVIVVESYCNHPTKCGEMLVSFRQYGTQRRATFSASRILRDLVEVR